MKVTTLKQLTYFFSTIVLLFFGVGIKAFADTTNHCATGISATDCDALYGGWVDWVPDDGSCGNTTSQSSASNGTDTPKWQTTLQPPYNLEDFVVEVLNDIAGKEGVPTASTVTEQHVLALVAFAYGEGGNLTNDDIYNPWNTGYTASDLQPVGGHSSSGVQSYASFNDGVEAAARVMTGTSGSSGYQSRLGAALKDPSTTAQQFMKALTYYQNYAGNLEWAEASMPPNQDSYYQGRLALIQTAQSNYANIASSIIGPPGNSYNDNQHTSKALRYTFSGDTSTVASSSASDSQGCSVTGGGAVQGSIVQTAVNLAWDDVTFPNKGQVDTPDCYTASGQAVPNPPSTCHHGFQQEGEHDPTQYTTKTFQAVVASGDGVNNYNFTDCGSFVSAVMHSSGVDKAYPMLGSGGQRDYMLQHPEKYTQVTATDTSQLQPGDIFVNTSHTYIYVGPQKDGFSVAEGSQDNHSPEIDNIPYFSNDGEPFTIMRVKN